MNNSRVETTPTRRLRVPRVLTVLRYETFAPDFVSHALIYNVLLVYYIIFSLQGTTSHKCGHRKQLPFDWSCDMGLFKKLLVFIVRCKMLFNAYVFRWVDIEFSLFYLEEIFWENMFFFNMPQVFSDFYENIGLIL